MAEPTIIILTEGETDDIFFSKLIAARNINDVFRVFGRPKNEQIDEKTGIGAFSRRLVALRDPRETKGIKAIIIVGDNDGNPAANLKSIKKQIKGAAYNVPRGPRLFSQRGNHRELGDLPMVSILMLPWDKEKGCLETLLLRAVNKKYEGKMDCVRKLSKCVKIGKWPISKQSKMMVRCLLSSVCKSEPNTPLTRAWSTDSGRPGDIFLMTNPAFDRIAEFLCKVSEV